MKKIVIITFSIFVILSLSGCSFDGVPTEIETTDFYDVQALLEEQYELSLPESVVFAGGYFDNAFRDPSITVMFTIEQSKFETMLSENWIENSSVDDSDFLGDWSMLKSFSADKEYVFQNEQFTFLWCDVLEDDSYTCVFKGRHPSRYF